MVKPFPFRGGFGLGTPVRDFLGNSQRGSGRALSLGPGSLPSYSAARARRLRSGPEQATLCYIFWGTEGLSQVKSKLIPAGCATESSRNWVELYRASGVRASCSWSPHCKFLEAASGAKVKEGLLQDSKDSGVFPSRGDVENWRARRSFGPFGAYATEPYHRLYCPFLIAEKLGKPFVSILPSSSGTVDIGFPSPFLVPVFHSLLNDHINFWGQVKNFLFFDFSMKQRKIQSMFDKTIKEHFAEGSRPILFHLLLKAELWFIGSDFAFAQPLLPDTVYVGGLLDKPYKPISEDLEDYITKFGDTGFVLVALGSMVNRYQKEDLKEMNSAFAQLSQGVIWKCKHSLWPKDVKLATNVKIVDWLPQHDLLAHPYIHLFVTHSGLNSIMETIQYAVPMAGIPLGDQPENMVQVEAKKFRVCRPLKKLKAETLALKMKQVMEDKRYQSAAVAASIIWHSHSVPFSATGGWINHTLWTVVHTSPYAFRQPWRELYLLDVFLFLLGLALSTVWFCGKLLGMATRWLSGEQKLKKVLVLEAAKILTISHTGASHYLLIDWVSLILQDHGHQVTKLLNEGTLIPAGCAPQEVICVFTYLCDERQGAHTCDKLSMELAQFSVVSCENLLLQLWEKVESDSSGDEATEDMAVNILLHPPLSVPNGLMNKVAMALIGIFLGLKEEEKSYKVIGWVPTEKNKNELIKYRHSILEEALDGRIHGTKNEDNVMDIYGSFYQIIYTDWQGNNVVTGKVIKDIFQVILKLWEVMGTSCSYLLHKGDVMDSLRNESFELVFVDATDFCSFLIAEKLEKLFVAPLPMFSYVNFGPPGPMSYVPVFGYSLTDQIDFWGRLRNLPIFFDLYMKQWQMHSTFDIVIKKHFPEGSRPVLSHLLQKAELWFVNSDFGFHFAQPLLPNTVYVGGLLEKSIKPIPQDLENFITKFNDSGFILVALGSFVSRYQTHKVLKEMNSAFANLSQGVIWKCDHSSWPKDVKLAQNVKVMNWLPQNDHLAHPSIRLFVTHGGINSVMEAIHHGVPIVGIPVCFDQPENMVRVKAKKFGVSLQLKMLTAETLALKMKEVIEDKRYKSAAVAASIIHRSQPLTPAQRLVGWLDHILQAGGGAHLKPYGLQQPWYKQYLLDVFLFLLGLILCTIWLCRQLLGIVAMWLSGPRKLKKT
ncbi:LOW QUALITY PROTEIN: uncharacterized protein O8D03_013959 [Erethizon dorsatum]